MNMRTAGAVCIFATFALAFACPAGDGAGGAQTDGEAWNEGVDFYNSGDVTNALRVLRPLMLTKGYGARAAEVVAKLELERGNHEEAAVAAQIALRANPGDARANRNFTRAVDGLLERREAKHIDDVLKSAQGKDHGAMLRSATYEARGLMKEAGGYQTNGAARVVALSDALSAKAKTVADVWLPVKEAICQSVTNAEQAATIMQQVDQARAKTLKASRELGDIDPEAYATLSDVEHDFTRFLKLAAMPPAAIDEDLVAQSNAWQDVEAFNGRSWQQDALDYTQSFRAKFPSWARAYEQQAQSDTNRPPFTAEDQAKISALATELEKLQLECAEKPLPPSQERAVELILQIRDLLPKDNGGQQGQDRQNQDGSNDGQGGNPQQQQQQQDQGEDGQDDLDRQGEQEQQPEEQQSEGEDRDEPSEEDREIEAVLKKAQERSDEHEAEKKARMRKAPLPPNERDW